MLKYLNYENGFYIELGAYDGITFSNTLYFEKHKKWTGILIEPVPHLYLLSRKNRSPKNKFFSNACVSFSYTEPYVEMIYAGLMSVSKIQKSDIKDHLGHANLGKKFLPTSEDLFYFGAKASTLNTILELSDAPKIIDFLSLDVEGAELEVLKGVNHQQYRFRYICVESRNIELLQKFLERQNYVLLEKFSNQDYLFFDPLNKI